MTADRSGYVLPVLGLSGVGKTHLIQELIIEEPICMRLSGADLVLRNEATPGLESGKAAANERRFVKAQKRAADRAREAAAENPGRLLLLDGHAVIDTPDHLRVIPTEVIRHLQPIGLVFLKDAPASILARRRQDSARRRQQIPPEEIARQQQVAIHACQTYAAQLSIRLDFVCAARPGEFYVIVRRYLDNLRLRENT